MPNFTQKHLSLILSAVAIVVVAAIAAVSYRAHTNNDAASSLHTSLSGPGVSNSGNKLSTTSNANSDSAAGNSSQSSKAAGSQTAQGSGQGLYLSPSSTALSRGATFTVQVRENSGSSNVNAVQANLSYPTDKLKFVSLDTGSSAFSIAAPSTGGSGKVSVARGSTSSITGDQNVATITFSILSTPGDATLAFTSGSALVTSDSHKNIAGTLGSDVYHIQ